ncbi:MAG TPA: GAF domain-containing protein, partial [Candidatus Binatia bacterium]|nr:GAF domain-containing protein [Candidatus Binatia bacterium]
KEIQGLHELAPAILQDWVGSDSQPDAPGGTFVVCGKLLPRRFREYLGWVEEGSFALAPLYVHEALYGVLWLGAGHNVENWTAGELEALGEIALCLGEAIEKRHSLTAMENRLSTQQALIEAGLTVSESLDLSTVLNRLAEQMAQAIGVTSAYLSDCNTETGESTVVAEYYAPEASPRERVSDLGVTYNLVDDFDDDLSWLLDGKVELAHRSDLRLGEGQRRHMEKYGGRSILMVPFLVEERIVGFAELWESRYERKFSSEEIALCKGMARQGAIAFENARLYEEVRQRATELELVQQVAVATARLVDIDRLLHETTSFIAERIYPDVFGFLLREDKSGQFRPHASYHGLPACGLEMSVPVESSVTGRVVRTGRPLIVNDVNQEPSYFSIVEETRSEVAAPMISDGEVIGVINVESRKRNAFSAADLRFLTTLAGQMVTAIERAKLYEDLERHADNLAREVDRRTEELKSERDRMLAIVDSAGEGIVFTDVDASILYVNPALEWQTGYSREECLGNTPRLWRSEQTDEATFADMWSTILGGKRWRGELVNRRKDGSQFDATLAITPLIDADGRLTGYVGVQGDISRLKEVDRLKSKFIANVSHELRTPLTNIRTYISLLERGDASHRERYLGVIQQESERLTRLIQDLLDLSRLEAKGRQSDLQAIRVAEVVEEATNMFAAQADGKQIALVNRLPARLPAMHAARSEIMQVLSNLLGNALTYTPAGGCVQVSAGKGARDERNMVWIRIKDNGSGISRSERGRLFERFFRGEAARRSGAPGTGLGLAICKEILENFGGSIELEPDSGEGASFVVWCPSYPSNTNGSR